LIIFAVTLGSILVLAIPAVVVSTLGGGSSETTFAFGMVMSVVSVVISLILYLVVCIPFALVNFALADHPEKGAMGAIRRSRQLMRGNRWKFFVMTLSFFGWSIVVTIPEALAIGLTTSLAIILPQGVLTVVTAVLTFLGGLPHLLWLTPYMHTTYAQCYLALRGPEEEPAAPNWPPL